MEKTIFDLLNSSKYIELENYILSNKEINLDIKDFNDNYFINLAINSNKINLVKLALERNARTDILDLDGRNILYYPIKLNYINILKLILEKNKNIIGLSILDTKDTLGFTCSHYCIILNNLKALKILMEYNSNLYIKSNSGYDSIQLAVQYNRIEILKYLLSLNINLNTISSEGQNCLNLSILYQFDDISILLLDSSINLDNIERNNGMSAIHQVTILGNNRIFNSLIRKNIKFNLPDYFGNTPLHYALIENNFDFAYQLIEKVDNFNISNYQGNTPLHIALLEQNTPVDIISNLIKNTKLNLQNNQGNTNIHLLIYNDIFKFENILKKKEINIFINNKNGESPLSLFKSLYPNETNKFIDLITLSYYTSLKRYPKERLIKKWEILCSKKEENYPVKDRNKIIEDCKKEIKNKILENDRSIPYLYDIDIKIDNGIMLKDCYFTGATIDILFGLLYLKNKFPKIKTLLSKNLSENKELDLQYKKNGIDFSHKNRFVNISIYWIYQKIIFPTDFDKNISQIIKNKTKYLIIPICIETENSHLNILFWDIQNKKIERFEPNGKFSPRDLNYNYKLLDTIILNKFKFYDSDISYLTPSEYLPVVGFQMLENQETNKCKIGDPNGFCVIWCIWWIYQKLTYINSNTNSKKLVIKLINKIKLDNLSFKEIIRNFSSQVVLLRDEYLAKINKDINSIVNNDYDDKDTNKLEELILEEFDHFY